MLLDLAVLAVLATAALAGAASGALRQLLALGAAVLGWLAARNLGGHVASGLGRWLPEPIARVSAAALLFAGVYAMVSLLGAAVLRASGISAVVRGPSDRGAGALLGGVKGALAAWVLVSALVLAAGGAHRALGVDLRRSDFAALADRHNLLRRLDPGAARTLQRTLEAARAAERASRAADPEVRRLLQDPRVRALMEQEGELDAGQAAALLEDPAVRALVERLARQQGGDGAPPEGSRRAATPR